MEPSVRYFEKLAEGLPVAEVMAQLHAHPELWNENGERTQGPTSPHYGVDDIWVRFRDRDDLKEPANFNEPHFAKFYPAWNVLTALHPIVFGVMARTKATYLGGILLTRIPPGGSVKPHDDRGGWHAEEMDTKIYVSLQSNPKCINRCMDEEVVIKTGEAWTFNNLLTHSVENAGIEHRITCIICLKTT